MSSNDVSASPIDECEWARALSTRAGMVRVETTSVVDASEELRTDPDHLFLSMCRQGLLRDLRFLWDPVEREYHVILALGSDVAGHPRITHGGLTAATVDETTGCMVLEGKRAGILPPGKAFTAHLEIDYRAPLPVGIVVLCTAKVDKTERRKIFTSATLRDGPEGTVYAEGKALYVTVRDPAENGGDKPAEKTK